MENHSSISINHFNQKSLMMIPSRNTLAQISNKNQKQQCQSKEISKIDSIRKKLTSLKNQVTINQKHKMTDLQAFYWDNSLNKKIELIPTFNLINIPKRTPSMAYSKVNLDHLADINFPIFNYTGEQLVYFATILFKNTSYMPQNINEEKMSQFVQKIALKYNILSYHNFSHAFSLSLMFHHCVEKDQALKSILTNEERFFCILAGLAHDLNHPGTNNNFEVKTKSSLVQKYGEISVLESMHLDTLWNLFKQNPNLNLLEKSENQEKNKKLITRLIFATDVAQHFKNLKKFSQKKKEGLNFKKEEDRYMTMQQLFHACDIGNPCLSFQEYINWGALVSHEFNEQYQIEVRDKQHFEVATDILQFKGMKNFYQGQKGFINGLVLPLWSEISEIFNGLKYFKENILQNLKELQKKIEETDEQQQESSFGK